MSTWWIALLIVIGIVAVLFAFSHIFLRIACGRNDRFNKNFDKAISASVYADCKDVILKGRDWVVSKHPEQVSTTSFDGLKLVGEYIPCENARGTVIMFHGWNASPISDFGAGLSYYQSLGLNLLLVHQRAQGKSEGKYMTFGIRERHDVHTWIQWHREKFGSTPVLLAGLSMGAATVLMACGKEFDPCVKGVIADCGFTSPYEIISSVIGSMHLPTKPIAALIDLQARLFAGFRLKEYSTVDAMKQAKLPILLAHGEADHFVPCYMSQQAYDACTSKDKVFLSVPKATHGKSFLVQPEEYKAALREFFNRCLK
ncbi:MAG: alpha/beta hydrolase [Ruminococcaceae bacterium]|nr:alpha/beta hydrolase [Oscillospiraceae bacterium]